MRGAWPCGEEEWSDHDGFDNLDLRRWRAECEAELRRPRTRPPTSSTSGQAPSPAVAAAPAVTDGTPRSGRLRPLGGAAAGWAAAGASQGHSRGKAAAKKTELHAQDRVCISEALFANLPPNSHSLCRDNTSDVVEAQKLLAAERARRQQRRWRCAGEEERILAAEWRRRKETRRLRARAGDAGAKSPGGGAGPPPKPPASPAAARSPLSDRLFVLTARLREVSVVRSTGGDSAAMASAQVREMREAPHSVVGEDLEVIRQVCTELSGSMSHIPAQYLRACLLELGLAGRTRHERLSVSVVCAKIREALGVPEERPRKVQMRKAFSCREAKDFSCALHQLGHISNSYVAARPWTSSEPGNSGTPGSVRASTAPVGGKQESKDDGLAMEHEPIAHEDFVEEVVPAIRQQLDESRQFTHAQAYLQELAAGPAGATALTPAQLKRLVVRAGLDYALLPGALARFGLHAESWALSAGDVDASEVGALDFEAAHAALLLVEEWTERQRRRREREILAQSGARLPEAVLAQCRHELVSLGAMFDWCLENGSSDGTISRFQALRLMTWLGIEVTADAQEASLVERILDEADGGAEERISFAEFMVVLQRVRALFRQRRKANLLAAFSRCDVACSGRIGIKDVSSVFAGVGLAFGGPSEDALVARVLEISDADVGESVSFADLEYLAQRVMEALAAHRARWAQHEV